MKSTLPLDHKKLPLLRAERIWSIREASKHSGLSESQFRKIENGDYAEKGCDPKSVGKIARAFRVQVTDILVNETSFIDEVEYRPKIFIDKHKIFIDHKKLPLLRADKRWSMREAAKHSGLSETQFRRIENGDYAEKGCSSKSVGQITRAFKIRISDILLDENPSLDETEK